ncbi:MAG TPA: molybdopterin dinucleotide binding domain-containing protein, partial [Solirubrobacter sp.]|nr:molybdopterin dinucleotide binding domain-containing protein [Solirubrobacter sp.]
MTTAMVHRDLSRVPAAELPGELTLRPVADDPATGVPLDEAAAAAMRADPRIELHPDDAVPRGLSTGDLARVFNSRGEFTA